MVEATAWRLRTGSAWRDLPDRFGSWNTIYKNFRRWASDGVWEDLLTHVQKRASLQGEIDHHAIGRSRGGLTTKIHLVCDGKARALAFVLTGGQVADTSMFTCVLDEIHIPGRGPARTRPDRVLADKGYPSKKNRAWLRERGVKATIPERDDQIAHRRKRPGRPIDFGDDQRERYKGRNVVERCFNFVKQWRGLASRYDKTARSYAAGICLSAALQWN